MDILHLGATEIDFIIYLLVAVIIGGVMGFEREIRGKDAGISTHILVICGSMLFAFLSNIVDPGSSSRIAAGVVSGIGFLGAGLILKNDDSIKNLTTAASIWMTAAIGLAIGYGLILVAIIASVVAVIAPRIPQIRYNKRD